MPGVENSLLVVSQSYPPEIGGNASRIGDMTRFLDDEGWDVTVLAPYPSFPHGQYERKWTRETAETYEGVSVRRLWTWQPTREDPPVWSRLAFHLTFALHALLWVALTRRSFDAMLTSTPPIFTAFPGFVGRFRWRCPWVVDVRDLWIDAAIDLEMVAEDGLAVRLSRWFQASALEVSDSVFVTTAVMRQSLTDQYPGIDQEKVRIVPNGVDLTRFEEVAPDGGSGVEDTEADGDPTAIYVGNIGHAQDLEVVIRALPHVDADLNLQIVGDGDRRPALERVAEQVGVKDAVEFTGSVDRDEVDTYLGDATIGLAPLEETESLRYAVPTKVYEYLVCGVPVVATGGGAIESFLDDVGGGRVVESDPEAVADTLDSLAADPEQCATLGRTAQSRVTEEFDRQTIAQRVSQELKTLVGNDRDSTQDVSLTDSETGAARPLVSVVIPTYNQTEYLQGAIESVKNQTYDNTEIIVVDDCSDDPSEVRDLVNRYDDSITLIRHEQNRGASAARNSGIEVADGEYIALLDADDRWAPQKLSLQLQKLRESPDAVVGVDCEVRLQTDSVTKELLTFFWGLLYDTPETREVTPEQHRVELLLGRTRLGCTSTLLFRREVVESLRGFDPAFDRHQDYEFLIRAYKRGEIATVRRELVEKVDTGGAGHRASQAAKQRLRDTFPDTVLLAEQHGYDVEGIHNLELCKQALRAGDFLAGYEYFRNASVDDHWQWPSLGVHFLTGLSRKFQSRVN